MFRDVPGLFTADGVPADLLRAGEPRLRRQRRRSSEPVAVTSSARTRVPRVRRTTRLITS